jgi:glycosyl transferase family 1
MRLFQNAAVGPSYPKHLAALRPGMTSFQALRDAFFADRYNGSHILEPVLNRDPDAFFANGDDEPAQRAWAREQGMPERSTLNDILLAQIEAHRAEVFYNTDPIWYGPQIVSRLPGTVKRTIAWRAAPSPSIDFGRYDLMVCNFDSILENYRKQGRPSAYFAPSHDPALDAYAASRDRPIDVLFIGVYSRHHMRRAAILETIAALGTRYSVCLGLDRSRMTRLAETPLGLLPGLGKYRRPPAIRAMARPPAFGRGLYHLLSRAKIVLNAAIDMAGEDRGNMRCWESLGAGALMVSDAGNYPEGMRDGETIATYGSADDAVRKIEHYLRRPDEARSIAGAGHAMIRDRYSKRNQWLAFQKLVG